MTQPFGLPEMIPLLGDLRGDHNNLMAFIKLYAGDNRWYICAFNGLLPFKPCVGLQILGGERSFGIFSLEQLIYSVGIMNYRGINLMLKRDSSFSPIILRNCL
jgi:hypothetical protein